MSDQADPNYSDHGEKHAARAILISVAAAVGGFLFGFDSSVINGAVDSVQGQFGLSSFVIGFIVAIALIGAAIGAWFAGPLADKFGRLSIMFSGGILFLISSLGSGLAFSAWDLAVWRLIGGLGIGIASVIGPTYISEVAPARMRGKLASLQQMAIVVGIFVALLSDAWLAESASSASNTMWLGAEAWRWMFLVGVIPSIVYGLLALTIPESPRFLVARGRPEKAKKMLMTVLAESNDDADNRIAEIQKTVATEKPASYADVHHPKFLLLPIVWVGIGLAFFQQFVGINVIFYYSTSLWKSVGFGEDFSFTASVITSIVNVLVTIVAILLVDKIGRRLLLLIGSVGMTISLAMMSLGFAHSTMVGDSLQIDPGWGPMTLVAANAFVVFFGASWGPVMWVLLGEMFPNRIRGVAMAISTAGNWIANFIVTLTFPALRDTSLSMTYGIYALFALLSFVFVYFLIPETKGKELEEMSTEFRVVKKKDKRSGA